MYCHTRSTGCSEWRITPEPAIGRAFARPGGLQSALRDLCSGLRVWHQHWQPHPPRPTTPKLARLHRSPCSRPLALSLFLLSKNVVPVVLVGFGYWLLTLTHTLLF